MIFPGTAALDDVSINFLTNEVHGLIGENGAGKSTFVKILAGILVPTLGEIKKDDENVYFETPAAALKLGIAYVSQEGSLVPQFSGAENIMLGFAGVTGAAIAKDDFAKFEAPNKEASKEH